MIKGFIVAIVIFLVATFPATWLLMLFLGNVHVNVSYWGALPLGILVSVILGGLTALRDAPASASVRGLQVTTINQPAGRDGETDRCTCSCTGDRQLTGDR
jgi:hypothetical protein